jgi:hypothetical protein
VNLESVELQPPHPVTDWPGAQDARRQGAARFRLPEHAAISVSLVSI